MKNPKTPVLPWLYSMPKVLGNTPPALQSWPDGSVASDFAFHPVTRRVYGFGYGTLYEIDDGLGGRIAAGMYTSVFMGAVSGNHTNIIYCPINNYLYIATNTPKVYVIDPVARTYISTITVGETYPATLQFVPSTNEVYLLGSYLTVINPATNSVVVTVALPTSYYGTRYSAAYCEDNGCVYYTTTWNNAQNRLIKIDPLTRTCTAVISWSSPTGILAAVEYATRIPGKNMGGIFVGGKGFNDNGGFILCIDPGTDTILYTCMLSTWSADYPGNEPIVHLTYMPSVEMLFYGRNNLAENVGGKGVGFFSIGRRRPVAITSSGTGISSGFTRCPASKPVYIPTQDWLLLNINGTDIEVVDGHTINRMSCR